jgi:ABC-type methionine transport system ATPase subunit
VNKKMHLTFPEELIREPIIYNLGHQFNVVTNIRRADIHDDIGWMTLEMEGEEDEIEKAVVWMTGKGVRVEPAEG